MSLTHNRVISLSLVASKISLIYSMHAYIYMYQVTMENLSCFYSLKLTWIAKFSNSDQSNRNFFVLPMSVSQGEAIETILLLLLLTIEIAMDNFEPARES